MVRRPATSACRVVLEKRRAVPTFSCLTRAPQSGCSPNIQSINVGTPARGLATLRPTPATSSPATTLQIQLEPQAAPRQTAASAELCQALNTTDDVYRGAVPTRRCSAKSHRGPQC
jgi:hypothetical protein